LEPKTTWSDLLHPGEATDFFARRTFPPFDPAAAGYSATNALWLAELCRLVYRHDVEETNPPPQPTRSHFLAQAGLRQRGFFHSRETDTQAMLVEPAAAPAFAALIFRGTEQNSKDLVTDLASGRPPLGSTTVVVHAGFQKALDSVWSQIEAELAKLTGPVFYTGHSLGGALATLAAARRAPQAAYTFGSPLVGNEAFVASLRNVCLYRVVDASDAVTCVPPAALGYRQAGELHTLVAPPRRFSWNPLVWLRRLVGPSRPFADHAPINYVDRLPG
jgi:hypothetical protein